MIVIMQEDLSHRPTSSNGFKLFLLGFITLFLELALIRYLAGNIWNLGFFPNLVLIAVFIGMGIGFIFHHYVSERNSPIIYQAAVAVLFLLVIFVYFLQPIVPGLGPTGGEIGGELFFSSVSSEPEKYSYLYFILYFFTIIAVFSFISQRTAKLFALFKPLTAYSLDIAGSCMGIISFMIISWFRLPAYVWFVAFIILFVVSISGSWKTRLIPLLPGMLIIFMVYHQDTNLSSYTNAPTKPEVHWSPYQKVTRVGSVIFVNGVKHQEIHSQEDIVQDFYQKPYADRAQENELPPYKDVLIIGSGAGNDVTAALINGAEHIDAVEIDPVIAQLGKKYNPSKPYSNPKVNLVIDDGRAFMTHTDRKYDLIIFALTDSLVRVSAMSQLRLENFLFTEESACRAYSLLKENGDLIFYNYYRRQWLVEKIQRMVFEATGKYPVMIAKPTTDIYFAMLMIRKSSRFNEKPWINSVQYDIPTDDWPFLYLQNRGIPSIYLNAMVGMTIFVMLLMVLLHVSTKNREQYGKPDILLFKLAFVFMGMAFLLLETKGVIQFSLLFGTTWINNSLVFLAVLVLVLAANWTALLFKSSQKLWLIYLLLLVSSLSTLFIPLENLLALRSVFMRFVFASLLTFSPIFFANLIFSLAFRDQKIPEHLFGWNLIGATIGGILEYTSMALGYNLLSVIVAGCYTLVFILLMAAKYINEKSKTPLTNYK